MSLPFLYRAESLSQPVLSVRPDMWDISEGQSATFICSVQRGSSPITFTWYNMETKNSLDILTTHEMEGSYVIYNINGKHKGSYYCESTNAANEVKRSNIVTIGGGFNCLVWFWKPNIFTSFKAHSLRFEVLYCFIPVFHVTSLICSV